jgi:hypothetical protein
MASQVSPGIVLKERDLSNTVIVGAQQITGAFASTFKKGPIGEIVNINSQKDLVDVFGRPTDSNAEDWYVASEFLSYGGRLAVVRASTAGSLNATTGGSGVLVPNDMAWESGAGTSETFVARTAGTWANGLKVVVVDRGADQIITLASEPDSTPTAGGSVTFNVGAETKDAVVVSYNGTSRELVVVLDDPTTLITSSNTLEDGATDIAISSVKDWYTNTEIGSTGLKLSAIGPRPGTSQFAEANNIKYDEIHIAVIDTTGAESGAPNTIVERLTYLSKLTDGKSSEGANTYYRTIINEQSDYIFTGQHPTAGINPSTAGGGASWGFDSTYMSDGMFALSAKSENDLDDGEDNYDYTNAEVGDAYDLFLDTEETEVDFVLMGGSMALETETKAKASKVISIAVSRKDCVAFVSPHKGNQIGTNGALSATQQKENTINFFNGLTSTSYAVFDSGYKYFYDRFNDKYRYLACNGDVAGLCVATSATLDDWYSPAGLNRGSLRNAIRLAFNPNKADRDELYQSRINPIVSFPGSGVTLFGDKTALASPSAFDRINVRRLFLNVEKRVSELGKQVLFELNDVTTRSSFSSAVNSYLNEIQARRGVIDYLIVCDESNNTPEVIDRNEFVAELYIKPTRSINYVTITFTATKTGVSFSEVVGR